MARIALVSRNPAMSMGLAATDHALTEVRPSNLDDWLAAQEDLGFDALVLDLGSPTLASQVIGDLRAQGRWIPVLLVAADPAVAAVGELPNIQVLTLPVDPANLQKAVTGVLGLPRTMPSIPPAADPNATPEPLIEHVPELDSGFTPTLLADDLPSEPAPEPEPDPEPAPPEPHPGPEPDPEPAPEPHPGPEPDPEPEPEAAPEPHPGPEPDPEPEPEAAPRPGIATKKPSKRRRVAPSDSASNKDGESEPTIRLDPSAPPVKAAPVAPDRQRSDAAGTEDPVETLLDSVDSLYTLEETASVIVDDAVVRSMADAGALLVPDGALWRVAAGVAIRPLEHRLQLTSDSWLIAYVGTAGKGILVEDSDVARQNLRGAPLASRAHLMAVPVPQVHAVLVLARDRDEPFTEQALGAVADLATESTPLLQRAMDLRTLARALSRHLNSTD